MTGTNTVAKTSESSDGGDGFEFIDSPGYLDGVMRRYMMKEFISSLPEEAQKRINALKHLQVEYTKLEAKFFEEVYQLECKYQQLYQSIVDRRKEIVVGGAEPTAEEAVWVDPPRNEDEEEEEEEEMSDKMKKMALTYKEEAFKGLPKDAKGIPRFWLTVFKNTEALSELIHAHDEPVLEHLVNLNIVYETDPMSYVIEFYFAPNPYFKDTLLTKKYFLRCNIDKDAPFAFEGPEIYKCTGCAINWQPGKNVTVKTIKKQQKHKQRGAIRTITKTMPTESFFNFFSPPLIQEDDKIDPETQFLIGRDFEVGHFLRARIIPKAVLYYTGEVCDDDDEDDDEEEEEEEEEEDEEEVEEEEEEAEDAVESTGGNRPVKHAKRRGGGGSGGNKKKEANPAECQQQ